MDSQVLKIMYTLSENLYDSSIGQLLKMISDMLNITFM